MTRDEYRTYRLEVLSKTDGKNIHFVNGQLGIILNLNSNMEYWLKKDEKKAAKNLQIMNEAMNKINKLIQTV